MVKNVGLPRIIVLLLFIVASLFFLNKISPKNVAVPNANAANPICNTKELTLGIICTKTTSELERGCGCAAGLQCTYIGAPTNSLQNIQCVGSIATGKECSPSGAVCSSGECIYSSTQGKYTCVSSTSVPPPTTNTTTKKPLNSLCQFGSECETGYCDTQGVAYAYDTNTQYGYCHVRPTPTNTPTPTTAVNCDVGSEVGKPNTCACGETSICASGYCDPTSHTCKDNPLCKANGVSSYTYDRTGCFSSRDAKAVTVICNDGTTKNITSSFGCTDTWRLDSSAQNFCSTHKTCPAPTPTNTPTPVPQQNGEGGNSNPTATFTPVPLCDPDPAGASVNILDMADFIVWKTDFLSTTAETKRSACLKPDDKIDLLDFQVWKNKSFGLR